MVKNELGMKDGVFQTQSSSANRPKYVTDLTPPLSERFSKCPDKFILPLIISLGGRDRGVETNDSGRSEVIVTNG